MYDIRPRKRLKLIENYDGAERFCIQSLPYVPFNKILNLCDNEDLLNLRLVSRQFESRVTYLKPVVRNWQISVYEDTQYSEIRQVARAGIAKRLGEVKLTLIFSFNISFDVKEWIMEDLSGNLTGLNIRPDLNDSYLETLYLPCLQHLTIDLFLLNKASDYNKMLNKILCKHAGGLESLTLLGGKFNKVIRIKNTCANLKKLKLERISGPPSLLRVYKDHLIALDIHESFIFDLEQQDFKLPKLKYLLISNVISVVKNNYINLVTVNSLTLVTLKLVNISKVPKDIQWPLLFPALKEVEIEHPGFYPILERCKETLECLILANYTGVQFASVTGEAWEMPQLTDLYLVKSYQWTTFSTNLIKLNSNHLKFVFVWDNLSLALIRFPIWKIPDQMELVIMDYDIDALYCRSIQPSIFAIIRNCVREDDMKKMIRKRAIEKYKYPGLVGL